VTTLNAFKNESVRSEIGNIRAIEGLRGVAVLWVVVFHYVVVRSEHFRDPFIEWIDASYPLRVVVRYGFLGVDLFFLITGFLLVLPWFNHAAEGRERPSARRFYWRRVRRIVPAYYVQLLLLFFVFVPLINPELWRTARGFVLANLGLHALFLHQLTPYSSASLLINGALWTLTLEMQYYVLLPLIAAWFVRAPNVTAAVFLASSLLWKALAAHDLQPLISLYAMIGARWNIPEADLRHLAATQLPSYLGHFALGILCGRSWYRNRGAAAGVGVSMVLGALAVGALAGLYATLARGAPLFGEHSWLLFPVLMAIFTWAAVSRNPGWSGSLLGTPVLAFIGRVSYSMYLYHLPLLLLLNKYAPATLGGLAFPCYFVVVVSVAALSFRYVEQPFMGGNRARRTEERDSGRSKHAGATEADRGPVINP
jgi:peptidoglycan/LPS O-acetylase OafA/YrhL